MPLRNALEVHGQYPEKMCARTRVKVFCEEAKWNDDSRLRVESGAKACRTFALAQTYMVARSHWNRSPRPLGR